MREGAGIRPGANPMPCVTNWRPSSPSRKRPWGGMHRRRERSSDGLPARASVAHPRLGEGLAVVAGWERAVELVLGTGVQAIVVDDAETFCRGDRRLGEWPPDAGGGPGRAANRRPAAGAVGVRAQRYPAVTEPPPGGRLRGGLRRRRSRGPGRSRPGPKRRHPARALAGAWLDARGQGNRRGRQRHPPRRQSGSGSRQPSQTPKPASPQHAERLDEARSLAAELERQRESLRTRHARAGAQWSQLKTEHDVRRVRMEEAAARARRNAAEKQELDAQLGTESSQLEKHRTRLDELAAEGGALRAESERLQAVRERDAADLDDARHQARLKRERQHRLRLEYGSLEAALASMETGHDRLLAAQRELATRAAEQGRGGGRARNRPAQAPGCPGRQAGRPGRHSSANCRICDAREQSSRTTSAP